MATITSKVNKINIGELKVYSEIKADPFKIYKYGDPEVKVYTNLRSKTNEPQDFMKIRSSLIKSGKNFIDPEFPHRDKSIGDEKSTVAESDVKNGWKPKLEWIRIKDIIMKLEGFTGTEKPIFTYSSDKSNTFSKMDIRQGSIGDCTFLSSLASISTDPSTIESIIFPDNKENESSTAGIYHFRLWYQGIYLDIVVDDYLPVYVYKNEKYSLLGCQIVKNGEFAEYWAPLIEKAYAKLWGDYSYMQGGHGIHGLEALTGGFGEYISDLTKAPKNLFAIMRQNIDAKYFLATAGCDSARGLVSGHEYSITDVQTVTKKDKKTVNLVRVRNPWGSGEWTGPWSDGDETNWSSLDIETRKRIKNELNDGEFWISYEDYIAHFGNMTTMYVVREEEVRKKETIYECYHGKWAEELGTNGREDKPWINPQYVIEISPESNIRTLAIAVTNKCKGYKGAGANLFKINNPKRELPFTENDFKLIRGGLDLFENRVKNVKNTKNIGRELTFTQFFNVEPGKYLIVPFTDEKEPLDFCVRVLGTKYVKIN